MFTCLDADPATLTGAALSQRLFAAHTDRIRADAAECRFLADWDARQVWAADGALSGAAWLRNHHGVASRPMRERLRVARRLRSMPLTTAAFEAGELAYEKVRLLANARTDVTAEVFDRDEPVLVDSGMTLDTDQFSHVMRYWRTMADAAGFTDDTNARYGRRRGWLSETLDGMIKLDALLDPETGRIVKQVLEEIMDELYRADRRDTEHAVDVPERTREQRVADAFAEMARRAAASNPNTPRRPRTETMLVLPVDALPDDEPNQTTDTTGHDDEAARPDDEVAGRCVGPLAPRATDGCPPRSSGSTASSRNGSAPSTTTTSPGAGLDDDVVTDVDDDVVTDVDGTIDHETVDHDSDGSTDQDGAIDRDAAFDLGDGTGQGLGTGLADANAGIDISRRAASAGRDDSTRGDPSWPPPSPSSAPRPTGPTGPPRSGRANWAGWGGLFPASHRLPTLGNGMPITWDTARRLACDALFRRVVINARSEILDLGRLTPNPSRAQRLAVTLRDGGCTFAGCDMPIGRCEVHHLMPYNRGSQTGGPTDLQNITLVCTRHHHLTHEGGFTMSRNPTTGHIDTQRPDGTPIPTRPRAGILDPYRRRQPDQDGSGGDDPLREAS